VRLQVQLVLEQEAQRNLDQAAEWGAERQQDDQRADIERNSPPNGAR
jgi:hypothetical protein